MFKMTAWVFVALVCSSPALRAEQVQPDKPLQAGEVVRYARANLDEAAATAWCPSVCRDSATHYTGRWLKIPDSGPIGDGCICGKGVARQN